MLFKGIYFIFILFQRKNENLGLKVKKMSWKECLQVKKNNVVIF